MSKSSSMSEVPAASHSSDALARQWSRVVDTVHAVHLGQAIVGRANQQPPIPVTVLTGFLGAGKTTLLQKILTSDHGLRITAIVNDLSAIGFDASQVSRSADTTVALNNGCACCSVIGDLQETLQLQIDGSASPDTIVVELSGIADAVGIAQLVENLDGVRLDGVVAVVDAFNAAEQLASELAPTLRTQVNAAHLVILSKTDLMSQDAVASVYGQVAALAPARPIVRGSDNIAPDVLLGCALHGARLPPQAHPHDVSFCHQDINADHLFTRREMEQRLSALPTGVVRVKGWCWMSDASLVEVQAVGRKWSIADPATDCSPAATGLTVITLNQSDLRAASRLLGQRSS
ncbi:MAG: GTP-binding protein [Gammaproteobacteria bacterium]|nr:GTP-binding protein [Gammaproteobacteria bacterium]